MKATVERLRAWVDANVPAGECGLRPGVDGESIDEELPACLLALCAEVDGQSQGGVAALDSFELMTRDECQGEKERMDELADEEEWPQSWWSRRWYPFGSDNAGQLLCVHMDTQEVIEFLHDDDARPVRAPELATFLDDFVTSLEEGERVYAPGYGIIDVELLERIEEQKRVVAERQAEFDRTQKRATWALVVLAVVLAGGGLLLSRL